VTDLGRARQLLGRQQVAAVIVVPATFDEDVAHGAASLDLTLNNVDIDFGDDIRRAVDRSVAEFDAPQLGASLERTGAAQGLVVPNAYRVDVAEHDLRRTTVTYARYQAVPVLILLLVNVGVMGGALLGARDHERRTAAFLGAAPVSRWSVVAGRLGGMAAAIGVVALPAVLALRLAHVVEPPPGHWVPLVALLAVTALLSAGIGVLLGSAVRQSATVALVAVTVSSYLFFLGGGFTTIAFLPAWLRTASLAVPTSYAIDAIRQILFYPDLTGVARDLLALCAFTAATSAGGVYALRRVEP
jgi:ABC-2 type transport system permease protein